MDEAAVEKAGAAPLQPRLDEIAALQERADLPALLAPPAPGIRRRTAPLFGFGSAQDFADSSRVIAFASAGGLGLPDRDYYLKTDAKSQEIRARYLEHVAAMLQLLGDAPDAARAEAADRDGDRDRSGQGLAHPRGQARPLQALPQVHARPAGGAHARVSTGRRTGAALGLAAPAELNVTEPEFFKEVERQLKTRGLGDWKTYLRWHLAHAERRISPRAFVEANFDFYSKYLRGVAEMQPRWKRCVSYVDRDLGEALGQVFVAKTFTPDTKARALAMTKEIEKAMEDGHPAARLDERRHQEAGARQAARHGQQDRLSRKVARLQLASRSRAATSWATWTAPRSSNPDASWPRSASPWTTPSGR